MRVRQRGLENWRGRGRGLSMGIGGEKDAVGKKEMEGEEGHGRRGGDWKEERGRKNTWEGKM